jgi:hypothetical protein
MTEIMRINPDKARQDPEAVFARPADIDKTFALTRGQKLAALRRWEADVARRLESAGEGMPSNGTVTEDSVLLKEIKIAIDAIRAGEEPHPEAQ